MMDHHTTDRRTPAFDKQLLRRAFLLALIPAVVLAGKLVQSAETSVALENGDAWKIQIVPGRPATAVALQDQPVDEAPASAADTDALAAPEAATRTPPAAEVPIVDQIPPTIVDEPANEWGIDIVPNRKFTIHGLTYGQVYHSIPFSRSEYLANPSYRHDTTMELLTGIPRQSVHANYESRLNEPIAPQPQFIYNRYGTYGGTFGGGGGYGGWGGGWGAGWIGPPQYAPAFRYFLPLNWGF